MIIRYFIRHYLSLFCIGFFVFCPAKSQTLSEDYKFITIDKNLKDFPDQYDVSSPLNAFVTFNYAKANGKNEDLPALSSIRIKDKVARSGNNFSKKDLDRYIKEVIIYKDSIAAVIPSYEDSLLTCWYFYNENRQWLNAGESWGGRNLEDAHEVFFKHADTHLAYTRKIKMLDSVSIDTTAFINYLKMNGKQPIPFLIDALKQYKLVIYGEQHFRKPSWDLMRQLIKIPEFHQVTGIVFLELSIHAQNELDQFFNNKKKDPNLILNIFRKEELTGWNDKGMYDFIMDLWNLNNTLPEEKKIKVVATDFPRPFYSSITTKEQYDIFMRETLDRNECMANTVERNIQLLHDQRSCLFIVGSGHAYKSSALHRASYQKNGSSVAVLLSQTLCRENIFSIFTHSPMISNNGYVYGKIRKGLYDYLFEKIGNNQIAFNLHNSPFGKELFDASSEICFDMKTGTFEENYDGYIFLQPVNDEIKNTPLYELFTDEFVDEIKKRASIIGEEKSSFWDMDIKDLNRIQLLQNMKEEEGSKRWKNF